MSKIVKISFSNCILDCCKNSSWVYNENELNNISKEKIERIIVFSYCIDNDYDNLLKLLMFCKNNNIKITIRTIIYRINIDVIKELQNIYPFEIEVLFNLNSRVADIQNQIKLFCLSKLVSNNINFKVVNIIETDDESELNKVFSNNFDYVFDFIVCTNLDFNKINEIAINNKYKLRKTNLKDEDIISLNYYGCDSYSNKNNFYFLRRM